jgi:3-hydroxyisobutyrate dehydrogenase
MTNEASAQGPIAFIGLGHMGEPMAARLAARDFVLRVLDIRADAVERFVRAHDAIAAASIGAAVRDAAMVIAMLPDDAVVRAVMLGKGGVAESLATGGIVIDMGTSSPDSTVAIAGELARHGGAYVDAPVMGGVPFARDGTLEIMAGGTPAAIERCLPVFAALGRRTWRCGASGSGHALKAIANFVNAATFIALLEGMTLGRKFGLETSFMAEALAALCAGRQHPLEKKVMPQVVTRQFATGMAMGLIAKDVGIVTNLARAIGARAPVAEATHALWREAAQRYGHARDQAEVVRLWEDAAGVEL